MGLGPCGGRWTWRGGVGRGESGAVLERLAGAGVTSRLVSPEKSIWEGSHGGSTKTGGKSF